MTEVNKNKAGISRNIVLLVALSFLIFIFTLVFIYVNNHRYIAELQQLAIVSEKGSKKMRLLSEISELARARTRLTLQILNIHDVFEQDELNQRLEGFASQFAAARQQLDQMPFSPADKQLYEQALQKVPVILPAQRSAVELMMYQDDHAGAQRIMYETVLPGQQRLIDIFGELISHEQDHIQQHSGKVHHSVGKINKENNYLFTVVLIVITGLSLLVIYRVRKIQNDLHRSNETLESNVAARTRDLRQARDEALKHSQAKSEFLSSMSHELRTPMNAILGFAQVLEMDELQESQRDSVQEILRAGRHLLELINEVLDLAKIEAGRMDLRMERVALTSALEECLSLTRSLAQRHQVDVSNAVQGQFVLYADYTRLKQVFLNLLSNAIKYNRVHGRVRISCQTAGNGMLRINIEDTGPGIPAKRQPGLFEPFNRLGAESSDIEGSGIGLIITRQLLEMMGGHIGFVTEVGHGSTFWVEMPLLEQLAGTASDESAMVLRPGLGKVHTGKPLILYIEDNPANMRVVEHIMQRHDQYQLLTAETPATGLQLAYKQIPDVILLDINLPDMDGFQVLCQLQENETTQQIPVIAVTANAMSSSMEKGRDAGFYAYVTKPIDVPLLLETIDRALSHR